MAMFYLLPTCVCCAVMPIQKILFPFPHQLFLLHAEQQPKASFTIPKVMVKTFRSPYFIIGGPPAYIKRVWKFALNAYIFNSICSPLESASL